MEIKKNNLDNKICGTIGEIALTHNVKPSSINQTFYRHKKHFTEGIDYFKLKGRKAVTSTCPYASKTTTELNIFTETGYLMLTKSFTDDLSWAVQRELVRSYFKKANVETDQRKKMDLIDELDAFGGLLEEYVRLSDKDGWLVRLILEHYRKIQQSVKQ